MRRSERLEARFADLLAAIELDAGAGIEELRTELRVQAWDPETPLGALSGGELAKLGLVEVFAAEPTALLLDEPTNHLDLDALEWLEERVRSFAGRW